MVATSKRNKPVQRKASTSDRKSCEDVETKPKAKYKDGYCKEFAPTHPKEEKPTDTNTKAVRKKNLMAKPTKSTFRMHLKTNTEETEIIVYNVQAPQRVNLRLENLMDSTEVRLNDKEYMSKWHDALVKHEKEEKAKMLQGREMKEAERVRHLVINGFMKPPEDLKYLYKHPVFRVNAMLRRLEKHKADFFEVSKLKDEVQRVEPFEYDQNGKFFQHMHDYGELWVPSEERIAAEEKLEGKIERAKQRLREKRRKELELAKAVRTIYKSNVNTPVDEKGGVYTSVTSVGSSMHTAVSFKRIKSPQREPSNVRQEQTNYEDQREQKRLAAKDRSRRQFLAKRELERLAREEERLKVKELKLNEERELERRNIIDKHQAKIHRYENPPRFQPTESIKDEYRKYSKMFDMQNTPPNLVENDSFKALRKKYELRGTTKFDNYRPPANHFIDDFDDITNTDDLYYQARAVKKVYERAQRRADDYMIRVNRMF